MAAPLLYGIYWLDFLERWDPKSPWNDRRVRLAASLAIDRDAINQAEMLGFGKPAGAFVPPQFDFALTVEAPRYDVKRAKQLLAEAGHANGFDGGDLTPLPPYTSLGETVANFLGAVGIRTRVRTMERATFMSNWHDKKLKGLVIGATGAAGNAAARLEPFMTRGGMYAYGSLPEIDELFQRQARELDRKQREALLHQIQKMVVDQVQVAPIFQQAFLWGIGPRVDAVHRGNDPGLPLRGPRRGAEAQVTPPGPAPLPAVEDLVAEVLQPQGGVVGPALGRLREPGLDDLADEDGVIAHLHRRLQRALDVGRRVGEDRARRSCPRGTAHPRSSAPAARPA